MRFGLPALVLALTALASPLAGVDTVTRIDDETFTGIVTGVDSRGSITVQVTVGAGRAVSIPAAEVLSVRFGQSAPVPSKADLVVLASGERCRVQIAPAPPQPGVSNLHLEGRDVLVGTNAVAFGDVRAWVPVREKASPQDLDDTLRELLTLRNERDVVLMTDGDEVTGVVESVVPAQLRVSAKLGSVAVMRERIRGVAFSKTIKPYQEPDRLVAEVRLSDGSVVLGDVSGPRDGAYVLQSVLGATWKTPADRVREIRFRGGKLVWLSELKPAKVEVTPFFNRSWPWQADRSVWGGPLTVGGAVYERGIGVHSRTALTWDVAGNYSVFIAEIAIDDETKGTGSALFSVSGDGRHLLKPTEVTGGAKPVRVQLDLTGVRQLTLLVDFGRDQDAGDHGDWLNARLLRK